MRKNSRKRAGEWKREEQRGRKGGGRAEERRIKGEGKGRKREIGERKGEERQVKSILERRQK